MQLDVLVFASHPDDAELAMGGTIAKFSKDGLKVGIVDLSKGELGTRGSEEIRKEESKKASEILGLTVRENLGLPDGKLKLNDKFVLEVVKQIRYYKPKIIFAPYFNDRHPDHIGTSRIVKEAFFFSGLTKIQTQHAGNMQNPFRPKKIFYYMQYYEFTPSFINDISETFETKMKSMKAYGTQFFNEEDKSGEPQTFISQMNFLKFIEARAKYFGFKIGKDYGEPFYSEEEIELDLSSLAK
ncbi:MAG: bacillithiol biosynthesis deacetylase BshB1 [Ignavibacteriales bacterium]|nr:MAG: bacillithiol biosynthesis deacetylase BshB1 [Ignavibacteriales bacterium]